MIIKTVRIGLLIAMIILSIYTTFFIAIPLLTSNIFAPILLVSLSVLIFLALREINRIMTWKDY